MGATGREEFIRKADVSRETLERLDQYRALLEKWNPRINLVSATTLEAVWSRHFLDSAQLLRLAPDTATHWADLGSGGGFPGLVIAAMAADTRPGMRISLVESDSRKAAFLRSAARDMAISVDVHVARAESLQPLAADVLSARALAPLDILLGFAERHLGHSGIALFPKGEKAQDEIETARKTWQFELRTVPSITDENASILRIGGLSRV